MCIANQSIHQSINQSFSLEAAICGAHSDSTADSNTINSQTAAGCRARRNMTAASSATTHSPNASTPTFVQRQAQAVGPRPSQLLGGVVRPPCSGRLARQLGRRRCRHAGRIGQAPRKTVCTQERPLVSIAGCRRVPPCCRAAQAMVAHGHTLQAVRRSIRRSHGPSVQANARRSCSRCLVTHLHCQQGARLARRLQLSRACLRQRAAWLRPWRWVEGLHHYRCRRHRCCLCHHERVSRLQERPHCAVHP